jgi:hypothetical protein
MEEKWRNIYWEKLNADELEQTYETCQKNIS